MHDPQPNSQSIAIRLVLALLDMFDNGDRAQLEAVVDDLTGAVIASVAVDLAQRVIVQAVDPDVLRESLRAELARLADDDGAGAHHG